MMGIYEELGVKKFINAAGTYTAIGATKMKEEAIKNMLEASKSYIDIADLLKSINTRIAEMTHNEGAFVCNSCSTAIYLTAAAFVADKYKKPFKYIADEDVRKCEFIGIWNQHIPYDHAIEQLGVKMNFIGYTNPQGELSKTDLQMAINENTVGIYFAPRTPKGYIGKNCLNLENVIDVSKKMNIPVLVDAAAQLPPKSNLWEFTKMGADIVTFSGGKDLAGPQASGLALGKKKYINIIEETGFPNYSAGRIMKIGREEMVALYTAVKIYMESDENERLLWCEKEVEKLKNLLSKSKIYSVERCWPNQAGQSLPRSFVRVQDNEMAERIRDMLMEFNPGVFCFTEHKNGIYINPMCMENGDTEYIAEKLMEIENSKLI